MTAPHLQKRSHGGSNAAMDQQSDSADLNVVANALVIDAPRVTSLRRALEILGDPWTMLILKEAFNGTRRFKDFQTNLNVPKQTLSLRLASLCRHQMLHRRYMNPAAGTVTYAPTAKTFDLQDAMYSIWLWHRANPAEVDVLPFDLIHTDCQQVLNATLRCTHCHDPVTRQTLDIRRTSPEQFETAARPRLSRRNDAAISAAQGGKNDQLIAASLVGDIPCNEILYSLFQGERHLMALTRELKLGAGVLRDRLDKLRALDLVAERHEGRTSVFSARPRADHFYPLVLSIAMWGDRWCNGDDAPPEIRVHSCDTLLHARFRCDHCDGWIGHDSIRILSHTA